MRNIRIPSIEIHGTDIEGNKFVLNRVTAANNAIKGSPTDKIEDGLERLRKQAKTDAYKWAQIYPNDTIRVVEVS